MAELIKEIIVKPELRPCMANGVIALFHKWITDEKVFLVFDSPIPYDTKEKIINKFNESDVIPNCCDIEKAMQNFALVEFEDGTIEKIAPENVEFLDSEEQFLEYEPYLNKDLMKRCNEAETLEKFIKMVSGMEKGE